MDRTRTGAWVDSLGDHPHVPLLREILGEYDRMAGRVADLAHAVQTQADLRVLAEGRHATALVDADRLARWIIAHPSEHDPTEVLNLHDRAR